MRVLLYAALFAVAAANAADSEFPDLLEKFQQFAKKFMKKWDSVEHMLEKLTTFHQNLKHMEEAQKKDPGAKYSHLSPLMDMTREEFVKRNSLKTELKPKTMLKAPVLSTDDLPKSFDWRKKGAVNAVKDQKQCGSCWTFATVANIEGANVVQGGGSLMSLSEQQLVDCSEDDNGCNGGLPQRAFYDLIQDHKGLALETDYPYHATVGECVQDEKAQKVFIDNWGEVSQDEDQIAAALVQFGPLPIGINANPFMTYQSGVAAPEDCDPRGIDHAVTLVGYGEENGEKYWTIRNSWGSWWGEEGYFRIKRGVGMCGMNQMVSTAIINPKQEIVV